MIRYRMVVLAIHRRGRNVRDQLNNLKLELGDTLLLMGSEQAIENIQGDEDLILLDRPPPATINYYSLAGKRRSDRTTVRLIRKFCRR